MTLADLESDWDAVFGEHASEPVIEIRRAALARSIGRAGLDAELDRFAELFFARRFALSRPFDDTLPALAALRPHYRLGLATNGNSRAERCGLEGEFAFELYAHVDGLPKKPAPAFFAAVVEAAGAEPSAIVLRRRHGRPRRRRRPGGRHAGGLAQPDAPPPPSRPATRRRDPFT